MDENAMESLLEMKLNVCYWWSDAHARKFVLVWANGWYEFALSTHRMYELREINVFS